MRNSLLVTVLLLAVATTAFSLPRPHVFIKNDGRWPTEVLFAAAIPNAMVWITTTGMVVDVRAKDANGITQSTNVRYRIAGSRGSTVVATHQDALAPTVSILTANNNCSALETATEVTVQEILSGIDLEYVWDGDNVRYNVQVDAGVALPEPLFIVDGSDEVGARITNEIVCTTPNAEVSMSGILSYQNAISNTRATNVKTVNNTFSFHVVRRDLSRELTIDPIVRVLAIRGNADEGINVVKRRADGMYVIAGWTTSASFAAPLGSITAPTGAGEDGFVAVVAADLKSVKHWMYISGAGNERINDATIGTNGQVFVVGETNSANFPVKGSSVGQTRGADKDGFLVVMSTDLTNQIMGSLINGPKDDAASGVAINTFGQIVIVGSTNSPTGLATFESWDDTLRGGSDGFIYMMNPLYNGIDFFTYVGGSRNDSFSKVVIDKNNSMVMCGSTSSEDFYTYPKKIDIPTGGGGGKRGGFDMGGGGRTTEEKGNDPYNHIFNGGASDVVVVKFKPSGEIEYSTYFGGSGFDEAVAIFIDTEEAAYIVGNTNSNNLPIINSTTTYGGGYDGFVATITADGLNLRGASYIGGTADDFVTGVAPYQPEVGLIVGRTQSSDFPVLGPGSKTSPGGRFDGFLARMDVTSIKFASTFALDGNVFPSSITKDESNDAIIVGRITTLNSESHVLGGGDAFVTKWAFGALTYRSPLPADALCAGKSVLVKWAADGIDISEPNSVDFSVDAGVTWTEVGINIKAREFTYTIPTNIPANAQCMFRVRAKRGHEVSSPATLNVTTAPNITQQPQSAAPCPNAAVSLNITVEGSTATYQWRKDGQSIAGATTPVFAIPSAHSTDNGAYDVIVTNSCLSITSTVANVMISDKPIIDVQPMSQTVNAGVNVVLSVTVRGSDLSYQWQKNGTDVSGATQSTLTLTNVTQSDAGNYACIITSACGSATSNDAMLAVNGSTGVIERADNIGTLTVYPQPASDAVMIGVPAITSSATLVVRSIQGDEVYRASIPLNSVPQTIRIATSTLPIGTYSVQLVNGEGVRTAMVSVIR